MKYDEMKGRPYTGEGGFYLMSLDAQERLIEIRSAAGQVATICHDRKPIGLSDLPYGLDSTVKRYNVPDEWLGALFEAYVWGDAIGAIRERGVVEDFLTHYKVKWGHGS